VPIGFQSGALRLARFVAGIGVRGRWKRQRKRKQRKRRKRKRKQRDRKTAKRVNLNAASMYATLWWGCRCHCRGCG